MAKKKKAIKKITLGEFNAWLEGLDDALGEDWVPDKDQWKRIRDKIGNLQFEQTVTPVAVSPTGVPIASPMASRTAPPVDNTLTPALTASDLLDVNMKPSNQQPRESMFDPKTPDIDTSNGTYSSPYA